MKIIWKAITGYEGLYEINNFGNVKSFHKNKQGSIIAQFHSGGRNMDYCSIKLMKNGKRKTFYIHILVANHFINNPEMLPEVDHIDKNTKNNNIQNLRWVTRKENCWSISNPIELTNLDSGMKMTFQSQRDAAKYLGIDSMLISNYFKGLSYKIRKKWSIKKLFYATT
jgi:hypothetical protein